MRFLALLKKELLEALTWIVLAAFVLLLSGIMILKPVVKEWHGYAYWHGNPDRLVYNFSVTQPLHEIALLLLYSSIGLGVVLAWRQFWMPTFLKMWAFTIHRSLSQIAVLLVKFSAAIIAFAVALGVPWTLFYIYASRPGIFPFPPTARVYIDGWIFILLGMFMYFGTALSDLSTARWYTTKICGIIFAFFVSIIAFALSLTQCLAILIIALVILISQAVNIFLNREF